MEKTTILARMTLTVDFTREGVIWLNRFSDTWFSRDRGSAFLAEHGGKWQELFLQTAEPEIRQYFAHIGIPKDNLPTVRVMDQVRGSWVLQTAITIAGTVGFAFALFKGVSELPEIADGLVKLKDRILERFQPKLSLAVHNDLRTLASQQAQRRNEVESQIHPPTALVDIGLVLDARPLMALSPALLKSHSVHLSVAISRDTFTLENLGTQEMRDVRLGLFSSATQRCQWNYAEAFTAHITLLSGRQTIAKNLSDFRDRFSHAFDLPNGAQVFVDCWVEDSHGIYLFRFFLDHQ